MKKIIIVSILLCSLLFPVFASAQTSPTQAQLTQQLIQLLTQLIAQLQQQIAVILAQNSINPAGPTFPQTTPLITFYPIEPLTANYNYNAITPANSVLSGVITFNIFTYANGGVLSPITSDNIVVQVCNNNGSCTSTGVSKNVTVSPSGYISNGTKATVTVNASYIGGSGYMYFKISEIIYTIGSSTIHRTTGLDAYKTPSVNAYGVTTPPVNGGSSSPIISNVNLDNNRYNVGDSYTVTWNLTNAPAPSANAHIGISLFNQNGVRVYNLVNTCDYVSNCINIPAVEGTGSYTGIIPSEVGLISPTVSNGQYKFEVSLIANAAFNTDGLSNQIVTIPLSTTTLASVELSLFGTPTVISANNITSGVINFKLKANAGTLSPITSDNIAVQVCNNNNSCTNLPSSHMNVQVSPVQNILNGESTVTVNITYTGGSGYIYFKINEINWTIGGITTHQTTGLDNYKTPSIYVQP